MTRNEDGCIPTQTIGLSNLVIQILIAALLAGSILAGAETAYITLAYGPFWLRPGDLLQSWLIYSAAAGVGLGLAYLTIHLISPWRGFLGRPLSLFFSGLLAAWVGGTLLLTALIQYDLDGGWAFLKFGLLAGFLGTVVTVIARLGITQPATLSRRGGSLAVAVVLLTVVVLFVASQSFGSATRRRTADWQGQVRFACLIVLDTVRADHLSSYGYPKPTTPNIDQLAAEGALFKNFFSASNWTVPGHISIFTGTYPSQHGNDGKAYTPDRLLTMTEILNEHGYFSIALYNNHLAGRVTNLTQGFDVDLGIYRNSWVFPGWHRLWQKVVRKDAGARPTFRMALQSIRWMANRDQPLFLYLNLLEPHAEYDTHEPYFSEFLGDDTLSKIPNLAEVRQLSDSRKQITHNPDRFTRYNDASYDYLAAAFDSELAYLDHQLGRFASGLREVGLLDEVLLVVTSDHGEFLGEHFSRGHPPLLFDPVLRVPLIMRYPDRIPPQVVEADASTVDILPTVLSLLGYQQPVVNQFQGIELLSDPRLGNRALLSENIHRNGGTFALIEEAHKLIVNDDPKLRQTPLETLLFHRKTDPHEEQNLQSQDLELTETMRRDLMEWVARIRVEPDDEIELNEETAAALRALGYVD